MKYITIFFVLVVAFILFSTLSMAAGPWKGRIIDIETKEPLENAVVLAVWQRAYRTPAGDNTYFYEAKEVLTDKEGRFEIPAYTSINLLPIISYIREPEFTIFKPQYGIFPEYYELVVVPVKNVNVVKSIKWKDSQNVESIEQGVEKEGIMFDRRSFFAKIAPDLYRTKFGGQVPFIPLENAEDKVRRLDIPFKYEFGEDLDNIWRVSRDFMYQKAFINFTVVGLKKLKDREERLRVLGSLPPSIPDQVMPNLIKLMNVEAINLGLQPTHVGGKSR